jgi:hypothetical protein
MDTAITVGGLLKAGAVIGGVVLVLALIVAVLAFMAKGWGH